MYKSKSNMVDIIFIILLFFVLTISVLSVLFMGVKVYKSIINQMDNNFSARTAVCYISEKIKQNDKQDALQIENIDGKPVLIINEQDYATYIYYENGYLNELFTEKSDNVSLVGGQEILKISDFNITKQESIFEIRIKSTQGEEISVTIFTRA